MSKVTICALTLGRPDMTRQTWQTNLNNAGCDYDLLWFDNGSNESDMRELFAISQPYRITWFEWVKNNTGISYALNKMIKVAFARGADYVVTMANDIIEPDNWLHMRIDAAQAIESTAVVAIPVQGSLRYGIHETNGIRIDEGQVIGNYLITRQSYDTIGLFCEDYNPYGPIDLDYCDRCKHAGLRAYYLSDHKANHLGKKKDNPKQYQQRKDDSLQVHWNTYRRNKEQYKKGERLYQMY